MSRREEILRNAEEMRRKEMARPRPEEPYDGSGMDKERMPLGCWLWVLGLAGLAVYAISRFIGGVD